MFRVDDDCEPCSLNDLCEANIDTFTDDDVAALIALEVGQSVEFGGGAGAETVITRVS